jgi:carboxypeptidase Taq
LAQEAWTRARPANDFVSFRPHLERVFDLRRQYADFFAPYDHRYDPMLDDFESGLKSAQVKAVFDELRPRQVALVRAIQERGRPVDDKFLHLEYDVQKQWDFGLEVARAYGYDFQRGRQDKSAHPFTTSFGLGDVRITTRLYSDLLTSSIFSTMHETGHALYDQGSRPSLDRSPLLGGTSLAVHESQSRMWENFVGRSRAFWSGFFPRLQATFPRQLGPVDPEAFYRAINKVQPSLIRVEADEATYNLHIMLRFDLELELAAKSLDVRDLPAQWNAKMREYLGLTPPDDKMGVLQDVHWSTGYMGYFPTYALGNLIAAQLWERIQVDLPRLNDEIARGQFGSLLSWLRENIHQHGSKFEPVELLQRVLGGGLSAQPYLRYLESKFGEIYGLS